MSSSDNSPNGYFSEEELAIEPPILPQLVPIVCRVLGIEDVDIDANLLTLGLESIDALRLANSVEDAFGVHLALDELIRHPTVRAAAEIIERTRTLDTWWQRVLVEPDEREQFRRRGVGRRTFPPGTRDVPLSQRRSPRPTRRRTVRAFSGDALSIDEISVLLASLRQRRDKGSPCYAYPSVGGLYPVQTYASVPPGGVRSLDPGVYYHDPVDHRLVLVSDLVLTADNHCDINRRAAESSSFTLLLIADLSAIVPIFGPQSRNHCLIEAGAIVQLLMMRCPKDLGICPARDVVLTTRPASYLSDHHLLLHTLIVGRPAAFEAEILDGEPLDSKSALEWEEFLL